MQKGKDICCQCPVEASKYAICSVRLYSSAVVETCLFLSIRSVCTIWLHDIKVGVQHMVGLGCHRRWLISNSVKHGSRGWDCLAATGVQPVFHKFSASSTQKHREQAATRKSELILNSTWVDLIKSRMHRYT